MIKQAALIYALFEQKRIFLHAMSFADQYMELRQAKDQGVAVMVEGDSALTGYAAGIGILNHAIAKSNKELKILIANASIILGPGFLVPARNYELLYWLLKNGFKFGGLRTS